MKIDFNADDFDFDGEYEKTKREIKKPNILVCGGTGVGKSSLINSIFGKNVAGTGVGAPLTKGYKLYSDKDFSVNLYDSEGYELGDEKQEYYKNEILSLIDKLKNDNPDSLENRIHEVWYCISASNKRITETDVELINEIKNKHVPIAIIITKIDQVDEEELIDIVRAVESNLLNMRYFKLCSSKNPDVQEAVKSYVNKEELLDWAEDNLDDVLKEGFITALNGSLKRKQKRVNSKIIPLYSASAAAAAVAPIPASDAALLIPIQVSMTMHVMSVYGIDNISSAVSSVVSSTIISQVGKMLVKLISGNLLKLIPVIGTGLGTAINTTVATTITWTLGYAISEMCYQYSEAILRGEKVNIVDFFSGENFKKYVELAAELLKNKGREVGHGKS